MKTPQSTCESSPVDAGEQLPDVKCPALIIGGSADPGWADLPRGLGDPVVVDGAGHHPHVQVPDEVLARTLPSLNETLTHA